MKPEAIYQQLGVLLSSAPNLRVVDDTSQIPDSTLQWLGKVSALIESMPGVSLDGTQLDLAIQSLIRTQGVGHHSSQIMMILNRVLSRAELLSPTQSRGAFISSGEDFDAIAALSKILGSAHQAILIVDPYLDETALTDFAVLASEDVKIALLADANGLKPGLRPALARWNTQYGDKRPVELRVAEARTLHDRLIFIDSRDSWILTQSLKDFAKRSPGTIQKTDQEISKLKFAAYSDIWNGSLASN